MASIGDFNSIIYFQMIAFGSIGGLEYLKTNFQSLQLSVIFRKLFVSLNLNAFHINLLAKKNSSKLTSKHIPNRLYLY